MKSAPPAPTPPPIQPDPALEAIKAQATQDAQNAQTTRTQQRTTDLLLRYGARSAFGGMNIAGGPSPRIGA
jgi:hypothetical protein